MVACLEKSRCGNCFWNGGVEKRKLISSLFRNCRRMFLLFLIDFQEVEGEGSPPTSADNVCFTKYGMGKGANFRGGSVGLSQAVAVDMCSCRVSLTVVACDCQLWKCLCRTRQRCQSSHRITWLSSVWFRGWCCICCVERVITRRVLLCVPHSVPLGPVLCWRLPLCKCAAARARGARVAGVARAVKARRCSGGGRSV